VGGPARLLGESPSSRAAVVRLAEGDDARPALSWQEELEKLLNPGTKNADREVLFRDLLSKGGEIAQEVSGAAATGDLASLVPPESELKRVAEDVQAVQRQVIEDVLPGAANALSDTTRLSETLQRAASEDLPKLANDVTQVSSALFADPEKALGLVQQEARNAISGSAEGLDMPAYTVLERRPGYEVRRYDGYGMAALSLDASRAIGLEGTVRAFNALSGYVLGANADGAVLEMTAPLRTELASEFGAGDAELSIMLPCRLSAVTAPAPSDGAVRLRQQAPQTMAVAKFAGLATDGEVRRRLLALRQELAADGVVAAGGGYSLLQYNSPYTLPFQRKNEIAVPVEPETAAAAAPSAPVEDAGFEAAMAAAAAAAASPAAAATVEEDGMEGMDAAKDESAPSDVDDAEAAEPVAEAAEAADDDADDVVVEAPSDVDEEPAMDEEAAMEADVTEADAPSDDAAEDFGDDLAPSD